MLLVPGTHPEVMPKDSLSRPHHYIVKNDDIEDLPRFGYLISNDQCVWNLPLVWFDWFYFFELVAQ